MKKLKLRQVRSTMWSSHTVMGENVRPHLTSTLRLPIISKAQLIIMWLYFQDSMCTLIVFI